MKGTQMPSNVSMVPYQRITDQIWPSVLEGKDVYHDEVINMMIAQQLLLSNHVELTSDKADERDRVFYKREESRHFGALNRYLQNEKYYRFQKRKTAGKRIILDFVNDGVYLEHQVFLLPGRTLRTHAYYSKGMHRQPGFVDSERNQMLENTGNVIVSLVDHVKAIEAEYKAKSPKSNEPVKVTPTRKKAAPVKKAGRRKAS